MRNILTELVFAFAIVLTLTGTIIADCRAIQYRDGNVLADSKTEAVIQISISQSDLEPQKLRCLANQLKERFSGAEKILAVIFTSHDAALHWHVGSVEADPANWIRQSYLHAVYTYDPTEGKDYVELFPIYDMSEIETKIDRRSTGPISCRAQVAQRCLVSLQRLDYPVDAFRRGESGEVTLTAKIMKNGEIKSVVGSEGANKSGTFSQSALKNLKTWKFEQAPTIDNIRIRYSYVFDNLEKQNRATRVHFTLPDGVTITASPMH